MVTRCAGRLRADRTLLALLPVLPLCLAATCEHQPVLAPFAEHAPEPAPAAEPPPDAPAGTVLDGVYQDGSYPFAVPVDEGWVAQPGMSDAPLRVIMEHVSTGATLEVWVFHEVSTAPRPRSGCQWGFADQGSYEQLRSPEARTVGTCVPDDPAGQMVLGTTMVRSALAYHFELLVPPGRLLQARRASESLLQGVAFY